MSKSAEGESIKGWEYRDSILAKYQATKSLNKTADYISRLMPQTISPAQVKKILIKMGQKIAAPSSQSKKRYEVKTLG